MNSQRRTAGWVLAAWRAARSETARALMASSYRGAEAPRSLARKYPAQIQSSRTVSQATTEVLNPKGASAPGTAEGTMSLVLLIAACSSIVSNKLPPVFHQSQASATDRAVT